jgi:hypothetical protein
MPGRDRSHDAWKALVAAQVSVPRLQMSLLVLLTGALMNLLVPDATSLGEFLAHYR